MLFDGGFRQVELRGDLLRGKVLSQERNHLLLALR